MCKISNFTIEMLPPAFRNSAQFENFVWREHVLDHIGIYSDRTRTVRSYGVWVLCDLQVHFISLLPSDLFHKLSHVPESKYTFVLKQLRLVNASDSNKTSQLSKHDVLVSLSH